jgi:hypothetical protein
LREEITLPGGGDLRLQKWAILAAMASLFGSVLALAQDANPQANQSTVKLDSVQKEVLKETPAAKPEEDLDKEITDPRLRAQSGSKNKYSASFSMIYQGANLNDMGGDMRPTLGSNRHPQPVSLSGNVGLRYRLEKNDSIFFSTGINRPQPLQQSETSQPTQVSTPSVAWNRTFAYKDKQISSEMGIDFTTTRDQRAIGSLGSFRYSLNVINPIGYSRFDAGMALKFSESVFNTGDQYSTDTIEKQQRDSSIGLSPSVQYRVSDSFNVFTSFDVLNYSHYRNNSNSLMYENTSPTETLGLGYAINRDCFLSPFITFEPGSFAYDRTTYSLAARINL